MRNSSPPPAYRPAASEDVADHRSSASLSRLTSIGLDERQDVKGSSLVPPIRRELNVTRFPRWRRSPLENLPSLTRRIERPRMTL